MSEEELDELIATIDHEELAEAVQPEIRRIVIDTAQDLFDTLGFDRSFVLRDNRAYEFLKEYGGERIKWITETTRKAVRETLVQGFDEGASTWQLMDRIEDAFLGVSRSRARKIAETEVTIAQGVSTQTAMEQAGLEYKQWLSTGDAHVRDTHRAMHGQVKRVSEPFVSPSGAMGMHPGGFGVPEEDIYCRCAAIPLFPGSREPEPWPPVEEQEKARNRRGMVRKLWKIRQQGVSRIAGVAERALEEEARQCKKRLERLMARKAWRARPGTTKALDVLALVRLTAARTEEPWLGK